LRESCKKCGVRLDQPSGRGRKKTFCGSRCRSAYREEFTRVRFSKECEKCGKNFESTQKKARFCSKSCGGRKLPDRNCVVCGVRFRPQGIKTLCCGFKCSKAKGGVTLRTIPDSKCKECGNTFRPKQSTTTTFCSRECAFVWLNRRSRLKKLKETLERAKPKLICPATHRRAMEESKND